MGIVDGFWFQVGRAAADIMISIGIIAAIFCGAVLWAIGTVVWERLISKKEASKRARQ